MKKLDNVCAIRERNFRAYLEHFADVGLWLPEYDEKNFISNFCFPIIHEKKNKIVSALTQAGVEVRPLVCGSMGVQPMYTARYGELRLKNASKIDDLGIYVPNNQAMTIEDVAHICNIVVNVIQT
jgi:CDP-6-deoxy-D-xylo-4-hexulose-3-dehydrase